MHQLTTPLRLIGATADVADVRHTTGFTAPDSFLFLDAGEQRLLLVSMLEYSRAIETAGHCRVLLAKDHPISKAERRRMNGCARFEDTIVVTRTGWHALAVCDVPLEV